MFRTLLTPLSARFSFQPSTPQSSGQTQRDELASEVAARDVLVEVMRSSIEKLKAAEILEVRGEVLTEIHKIMLEDVSTKDAFRETDGFLVVISVLSALQTDLGNNEIRRVQILDATRLAFVILAEALYQHGENVDFFKRSVGYDSLTQAVLGLVSDRSTIRHTLGFLVALALHKFSMSGIFDFGSETDYAQLDHRIRDFEPAFGTIFLPEALSMLYGFIPQASADGPALRYSIFKLLERLSYHNHRNHCVLSSLDIAAPLFKQYCAWKDDVDVVKQERQLVQKLLRRLIDVGTTTDEARLMFQHALRADDALDPDVLELLRAGMKVKWPEHVSLQSPAALQVIHPNIKGLPSSGFTFMMWLWIETFPTATHTIFSCHLRDNTIVTLLLRPDGTLAYSGSPGRDPVPFNATIVKTRWIHLTLVHYPHRLSNPTVRFFLDGALVDALNWHYPGPAATPGLGIYQIGDSSDFISMSWCFASAYFIASPLGDSIPRFIHHLGPRYSAQFQTTELGKFLTYEASTALHIHLDGGTQQSATRKEVAQLHDAIRDGLKISQSSLLFTINPSSNINRKGFPGSRGIMANGDVFITKRSALDLAMWRMGGATVALRLVQLSHSAHEVSRALGVLVDGLKNSWQNSEDMERLRGYDLLAAFLRVKSQHINMTGFETLFEFLGFNFRTPDQSTIVNTVAYRAIALDFQLWASTREEIQRVHLEHFATLLSTSKFKRFNMKQRIAKMGVIRKLLFVLQTSLYSLDMLPSLIGAIKAVAQAQFTIDDAIKPIVSYLATNLHEVATDASSPRSMMSRIDYVNSQCKAEQVLGMLVSVLSSPTAYAKFSGGLPVGRVCLLLLGERPSPVTASLILQLVGISLSSSVSFSRKFELASGWNVLKAVLPHVWDPVVQKAAFDLLFGQVGDQAGAPPVVSCPQIMPSIFSALKLSLDGVGMKAIGGTSFDAGERAITAESLLEELIQYHSTIPTFRHVFKSQAIALSFIEAYKSLVTAVSMASELYPDLIRILEKLSHLGLSIALDNNVSNSQKEEIMEILQSAESALNPRSSQETAIDSAAIVGSKPRRRRMASVRLSVQLGESTVKRSISRIQDWRKTVIATEQKRLRKTVLDLREYHRQISSLTDWAGILNVERGLWANLSHVRSWRLDETEGPYRTRKRLEPTQEYLLHSLVDIPSYLGDLQLSDVDVQSVSHLEVPSWSETYESSTISAEPENNLEEEIVDDKHRRVRHELEPGDVIEAAHTTARIVGVDSYPGLLIFGRTHIYMLDGLIQNDNGEVIDARDAPKRLFFIPGSIVELNGPQRAQRWSHDQVVSFSDRAFLFRDVGLEIYFKDSRSLLVVFLDKHQRQDMNDRLSSLIYRLNAEPPPPSPGMLKSPLLSPMVGRLSGKLSASLSAKVLSGLRIDELSTAQRKWQAREISNFTYLSILNQISGRTPSDATQYPVFPWVLRDYSSPSLDLHSIDSFRDLTRPMGALTPTREEAARTRYANLESVGENPFHYGTHFSSSMIVCHFLIRLEPFSHMFRTLQGGDWDLPDRLFSDIGRAYESASTDVRGDVRELIPEFYCLPEFLENSARINFGVQQNTGERIDDVKLPLWAKRDPLLFIELNRQALESDYVSEHLPQWIDLIWGHKQRDQGSLNAFHPLSYAGSIDLDSISDDLEREATVGIIHNFGQTPRKIFHAPHPERMMHGNSALPIGTLYGVAEDYLLLSQSARPVKDLGPHQPIRSLEFDMIGQRIIPCSHGILCVPSHPHEQVEWLGASGDLKVLIDQKVIQVVESTACSCAAFADSTTLVTGSHDHMVRLWRLQRGSGYSLHRHKESPLSAVLTHVMRAHTARVMCVTASRSWSIVVSGSMDGSAVIWDLNRGAYVRTIWHGPGDSHEVYLVAINESTGYIATCSRSKLCLNTINGRSIATLDLVSPAIPHTYPAVTSMAFLERDYTRTGVIATGGPNGAILLRTWNTDKTEEGRKAQWDFVTLRTLKVKDPDGEMQVRDGASCVTALKFVGETLYHGEDTGRVFSWNLPD